MPRFFIELAAPFDIPDVEGGDYFNADHARADAVKFLGEVLSEDYDKVSAGNQWIINVHDENDQRICCLTLTVS